MARKRVERNLAFDEEKGLYYACFDYGRDGTGRRVRQTKCFRDRTAAQEALCQFELKRLRRQLQLPSRLTVGEWLDYWLEQIIRPNREDTTYYCYRGMARNHIIPALGQVPLQQLDPYRIQRYYGDMLQRKGLGANTVYKHHILLHTALKAAFRQGILPDNPVDRLEPPRLCSPRQYFYTPEQLRTLFHAVVGTRLELVVLYLAAGSESLSEESWRISFDPERQEVRSIALSGTVNGLPLERLELSPLGAALYTRKASYDGDLAVHLSDGTVLHPEMEGGGATNGMEGPVSRYWSFAEPVDPAEITGISLQYWFIPLNADDTAAPGRWLSELPA